MCAVCGGPYRIEGRRLYCEFCPVVSDDDLLTVWDEEAKRRWYLDRIEINAEGGGKPTSLASR